MLTLDRGVWLELSGGSAFSVTAIAAPCRTERGVGAQVTVMQLLS